MTLLELLWKMVAYIIVAPVLSIVGALLAVIVLALGVLASPVICIVSLFFKEPYKIFNKVFQFILKITEAPFVLLLKILG